ncbi:MAG: hypothetical protein WBH40_16845, partial [Ignavibacteriaceae bacterium]
MKKSIVLISVIFLLPFYLFAQDENHETSLEGEDHFHYNQIALFTGASTLFERDETHFTLGADYIRYFSPESNFAAGVFAEAIFALHTEWLFGALLYYGLTKHLWVRTGPGIEILQEENEHNGETESKTEFLIRFGAGYSIHFGRFFIDPSIDI